MKVCINANAITDKKTFMCWGDAAIVIELAKVFKALNHQVVIHKSKAISGTINADLVIDLFGSADSMRERFPARGLRVCWLYSHPRHITPRIVKEYSVIFCASKFFIPQLKKMGARRVVFLPKCTHIKPIIQKIRYDIAFCGNTKGADNSVAYGRRIIDELDPLRNKFDLVIYGLRWERFSKAKIFKKGSYFPNERLGDLYGASKICLNDCADDMKRQGFIPVRVFDILGSGSLCISSPIKGMSEFFNGAVVEYNSPSDLVARVRYYLKNSRLRQEKIKTGLQKIHGLTYGVRARTILSNLN